MSQVEDFNVRFNQGNHAVQTIERFHIHAIRRREYDVANPTGGEVTREMEVVREIEWTLQENTSHQTNSNFHDELLGILGLCAELKEAVGVSALPTSWEAPVAKPKSSSVTLAFSIW